MSASQRLLVGPDHVYDDTYRDDFDGEDYYSTIRTVKYQTNLTDDLKKLTTN